MGRPFKKIDYSAPKRCSRCHSTKHRSQFGSDKGMPDGLNYRCKACAVIGSREYRKRNPEKYHETLRKAQRKALERDPRIPRRNVLASYGITHVEYDALKIVQQNRCAICGVKPKKLVIDHNHNTGNIRALLCSNCNTGLGLFQESIQALSKAIAYVDYHNSKQHNPAAGIEAALHQEKKP